MNKIMQELHQDHIHLARLLKILEHQVEFLKAEGDPDMHLILDIVYYIQNYPDLFHHPKEDQVYRMMKKRSADSAGMIESLLDDHQHMPTISNHFFELIDGLANGGQIMSRDELIDKLQTYIDVQKEHMNSEEKTVFPLINATLNESDWDELEEKIIQARDPLFGTKQVEARYQSLCKAIENY